MSAEEEQTRTPERMEAEIEQTREELADTVEALAQKTDVKAQAKAKAAEVKEGVQDKAEAATASLPHDRRPFYVAALIGLAVAIVVLRRR